MADTKPKPVTSLRAPGPKKKLGLAVPPALRMPHEELIKAEDGPIANQPEPVSPTPRTPPTAVTARTDATHPIAPARDFTRVANSIVRDVVPGGHFVGKSKQLYDFLYQRTRGAIVPVRKLTISKPALMRASGIGSERTLLKNLGHLKTLGLIRVDYTDGKHEGNSYEVFLPEEVGLPGGRTPRTPPTPVTPLHARADMPSVLPVESDVRDVGSAPLDSTASGEPKTSSFKTKERNDDDEALAEFADAMGKAAREITGRELSPTEAHRWRELAEVLVTELKIAAGRTTVSSVPAFLAEHLRRRLFKKDKAQLAVEESLSLTTVNPSDKVNSKQCPDCFGTGMFYPSGYENGVARCTHEKLKEKTQINE